MSEHISVLLNESVTGLNIDPEGIYMDGTFGRGGHSRAILAQLGPMGRLIAIDKDPSAIATADALAQEDPRFSIHHCSFSEIEAVAQQECVVGKVAGVLLDLGVSSPQLDQAERGFSFIKEGPLDMRMNNQAGETAADWLNHAKEQDIANVLWQYGEERFSRRIAKAIVMQRVDMPFTSTQQLASLIEKAVPRREKFKHPATRSFQAIRIHINRELVDIEQGLAGALNILAPQGRLAVISFHSLEDRIVKRFIREQEKGRALPHGLPVQDIALDRTMKRIGKAIKPTDDEIKHNQRSRSSVLRIAEKL